jgi:prevent-host-death family protein
MANTLSATDARRAFHRVLDAAERGKSTVILRRGKPVAQVKPVPSVEPRPGLPKARRPGGLASLVGLFADWETIDEDIAEIMSERQRAFGRPLPPELA